MTTLDLSIIVPLYNEEQNVEPLHRAVAQALEAHDLSYELVLVDDGSDDETFAIARRLAVQDPHVRVIKFRRNFGQTPAMVAGIDHARGRVIVTMDGDLQNDPADIPLLLDKIAQGYDLVAGWRQRRQDKLMSRVLPSKMANWLIAKVTGVPIKDNGCSLKAFRADLIKNVPLYSEMHRFIPAMTSLAGAKIVQMPVRHHPRKFGESKYGLSRVYKVLFDLLSIRMVLVLAARPLFSYTGAAILAAVLAMVLLVYNVAMFVFTEEGLSLVFLTLSLLLGVLALFLVSLGLLAQLVYKTGTVKAADFSALTANLIRDEDRHGGGVRP